MNFTIGLNSNSNIETLNLNNSSTELDNILTPEYFIQTVCILKNLQDFYSLNIESINDIVFLSQQESQTFLNYNNHTILLADKGCIFFSKSKTGIYPLLYISNNNCNSVFGYNKYLNYDGLKLVYISLFSKLVQKYKTNKRYVQAYFEPLCTSLGENITFLIENNKLEYLNVDTLPSFSELVDHSLSIFSDFVSIIEPPINYNKISDDKNSDISFLKDSTEKDVINYINSIIPNINYKIDQLKGLSNIYKFPKISVTENVIYPNLSTDILLNESKNIKSIFLYWLLEGSKINFNLQQFSKYKKFENQSIMHKLFSLFTSKNDYKSYLNTWSLSQVKNVENDENLIELVGKFLYGKKRSLTENKVVKDCVKKYSKMDDITFYYEVSKYYKSVPYDRSIARVKELEKLNILDDLKEVKQNLKYLDFGGGDGQNAYAISEKLGLKKGDVYVSDIQSWFGNENVQKYNTVLTYRYLKSFYLPFEDNMFDFITCFQVLHHIREYELTIRELYRIMKVGGILVIREHDCYSNQTSLLIDIEHSLFEISGKIGVDYSYLDKYYAHYFSKSELYSILYNVGFKNYYNNTDNKVLETEPLGVTRYYLSVFKK